jgi:1,4-dihydroxy-2-naphthoyl-CoA hydrolase
MANDDLTAQLHQAMPLCATLGMTASEFGPGGIVLHVDWAPERCTSNGLLHGGTVMALADAAGGAAAFFHLPDGAIGTSTIESKTNFFRGVTSGTVTATATPLHVGSTTVVIETVVTNSTEAGERMVAKVTQTQAVLRPRS